MAARLPSSSSDLFGSDDPSFLEALANAVLPGDVVVPKTETGPGGVSNRHTEDDYEVDPSPSQASRGLKRRRSSSPPSSPTPALNVLGPEDYPTSMIHKADDGEANSSYMEEEAYKASRFGEYGDYMRRKRAKLQVQNSEIEEQAEEGGSKPKPKIFKGLAIHINGFTVPSVQVLRGMITQHGGIYHAYLDKKTLVTHVVATNLTPSKVIDFARMKTVKPDWIVKSIEAGKLLPWRDFVLHTANMERVDEAQGMRTTQKSLFEGFATQAQKSSPKVVRTAASGQTQQHSKTEEPCFRISNEQHAEESQVVESSTTHLDQPALRYPGAKSPSTTVIYSTDPVTLEAAECISGYAAHPSNVNAARLMADPEWAAAHTSASGADYIEGYYQKSRLHHLSMWKAELKELVVKAQARVEDRDASTAETDANDSGVTMVGRSLALPQGKARMDLKGKGRAEDRVIMHCDFDSFFVAAGLVDRPELKGKPVVVCHSQGKSTDTSVRGGSSTSEVASASYEARKFGIKNGMSLGQARRLCPVVETIPYEFEKYKDFSLQFYTILMTYVDDVQAVSVDEALVDVTSTVARSRLAPRAGAYDGNGERDHAKELAETIRDEVRKATGCEISVGISHNILLARLATKKAKPAGTYHLLPADAPTVLEDLDVGDIHGVGWSIREKVETNLGVTKVGELAKQPKGALQKLLGPKLGEKLWNAARGIDNAQIESHKQRKSVSAEVNYGIRFETEAQAERFVRDLSQEVARRLSGVNMKGRLLTLKLMKRHEEAPVEAPKFMGHGHCDTFNKSTPISARGGMATDDPTIIGDEAWKLLKGFGFDPKELRGIGLQIQKLEGGTGAGIRESKGPGQGVLAFQKVPSPSKRAAIDHMEEISREQPPLKKHKTSPEHEQPAFTQLDLPSISQIHSSVLDSLPEALRLQISARTDGQCDSDATTRGEQDLHEKLRVAAESQVDVGPSLNATVTDSAIVALPSFTQLDQSVLEALPADIREELEREYTKSKAAPLPPPPEAGPSKPAKPKVDVKHITKQLAAKGTAGRPPAKYSIFKKREPAMQPTLDVSDEELLELQIDPDVFRSLPGDVQREQLDIQRQALKLPPRPNPEPQRGRSVSVRPSRSPSAAPKGRPVYRANRPVSPHLNKVSDTSAIRDLVERWFRSGPEGPHEKDLKRIGDFLVRCLESPPATDAGLEKVTTVMQWWRHLCLTQWKAEAGEELLASKAAWWDAFDTIKARLDAVVRRRFGGTLSLA